jgi:hypothetical protein
MARSSSVAALIKTVRYFERLPASVLLQKPRSGISTTFRVEQADFHSNTDLLEA